MAKNPFSKAKDIAKRGVTAVKSTPKAAKAFGKTLVSEGRKDLRDPNSSASRFARAPLGQSYLPEKVQAVGRALLPTPGGVVKSYQKGAKEGGLKGFGRIAMTNVEVLSLGTLGAAGRGAVGAGKAASRVASRGMAARGLSVASELGAVGAKRGSKAARLQAIQKKMATETAGSAASVAERAAAVAKTDAAEVAAKTSKMAGLSDEAVRAGLKAFQGRSKALIREAQRRGISALPSKAAPTPLPSTIGVGGGAKPPGDIMEYAAQKLGSLGRVTRTATSPKGEGIRPAVAKAMGMPAQTMGASEPLGVSKARPIAERAAKAAQAASRKPGKVTTRPMTAAEKASFDSPKTSAGFDKPAETLGVTRSKPSVKVPSAKPAKAPPAEAVGTATKSKAAAVAERGAGEAAYRESVRSILGQKKVKRGAFSKLAKQHGISRQRVNQVVQQERKRLNLVQATNAMPEAGSATNTVKTAAKATQAKGTTVAAKPTNVTPAATTTTPKAAKVSQTNPNVKNSTAAARVDAAVSKATAPAEKAVKLARKAAGETGAQKVKGKTKFLGNLKAKFPKKTAALAGAAVLLANRDKFGAGGKGASTPAAKSEENAFIKNLPDGLRQDIEALVAVKEQKGEAGINALVTGLKQTKQSAEYTPSKSDQVRAGLYPTFFTAEQASALTMKRIDERRQRLLQRNVSSAYEREKKKK